MFVLLALAVIWRPLVFASVDPDIAASRGVPVRGLSPVFMLVLGLTVAMAIQVVGALLVLSLLVTPAAAAMRVTASALWVPVLSVIFAMVSTVGGILLALGGSIPISPYITTISFTIWVVCRLLGSAQDPPRLVPAWIGASSVDPHSGAIRRAALIFRGSPNRQREVERRAGPGGAVPSALNPAVAARRCLRRPASVSCADLRTTDRTRVPAGLCKSGHFGHSSLGSVARARPGRAGISGTLSSARPDSPSGAAALPHGDAAARRQQGGSAGAEPPRRAGERQLLPRERLAAAAAAAASAGTASEVLKRIPVFGSNTWQ